MSKDEITPEEAKIYHRILDLVKLTILVMAVVYGAVSSDVLPI